MTFGFFTELVELRGMTFGFIQSLGRTGAHRQSLPAFFRPPFAGSQTPFSGVRFPLR